MKGYIGVTSYGWADFLKDKNDLEVINFWCTKKTFKVLDKGDYFFFLRKNSPSSPKKEREIVGYAQFDHFEYLSLSEAWNKYGIGNGSYSLSSKTNHIKDALHNDDLSSIGCIILNKFKFFEKSVLLSELDIPFQNNIVSGKSITEEESNKIINALNKINVITHNINTPLPPRSMYVKDEVEFMICGNCDYHFSVACRCPECGQLATNYDELMLIEKYKKIIN